MELSLGSSKLNFFTSPLTSGILIACSYICCYCFLSLFLVKNENQWLCWLLLCFVPDPPLRGCRREYFRLQRSHAPSQSQRCRNCRGNLVLLFTPDYSLFLNTFPPILKSTFYFDIEENYQQSSFCVTSLHISLIPSSNSVRMFISFSFVATPWGRIKYWQWRPRWQHTTACEMLWREWRTYRLRMHWENGKFNHSTTNLHAQQIT